MNELWGTNIGQRLNFHKINDKHAQVSLRRWLWHVTTHLVQKWRLQHFARTAREATSSDFINFNVSTSCIGANDFRKQLEIKSANSDHKLCLSRQTKTMRNPDLIMAPQNLAQKTTIKAMKWFLVEKAFPWNLRDKLPSFFIAQASCSGVSLTQTRSLVDAAWPQRRWGNARVCACTSLSVWRKSSFDQLMVHWWFGGFRGTCYGTIPFA